MTNRDKAKIKLIELLERYDALLDSEEYERAEKVETLIIKLIDYINR